MKFHKLTSFLFLIFLLSACHHHLPDTKWDALAELYNQSFSDDGIDGKVTVLKEPSETSQGGREWVVLEQNVEGSIRYFAVDLTNFEADMTLAQFSHFVEIGDIPYLAVVQQFDEDGIFTGEYTLSYDQWVYGDLWKVGEHFFEVNVEASKDLERVAALIENKKAMRFAHKLQSNFGLSEERSFKIAKTTRYFHQIQKKRSLTQEDYNQLSRDILGLNYSELNSLLEADSEEVNNLIERASEHNQISPEHLADLINIMF